MLQSITGQLAENGHTHLHPPTAEYAVHAWAPWLLMDIELMQKIYHRSVKMVIGLQNLSYSVRLNTLNPF